LRGRPVIVGGLGPRGVVSTASYEARAFGVRSAMPMAEARARCPHAAFLAGRFGAYHAVSDIVMTVLRELSPRVEPLSLDEAFVDLAAGPPRDVSAAGVRQLGVEVRADIHRRTAITASVGAATSKLMAKIASEQAKPDGLVVVEPGTELALLHPLPVRALPGVGPATAARIARLGVKTVGELAGIPEPELVAVLGESHGRSLHRLSRADDDRAVVAERESKSISVEDTFDRDLTDPALLAAIVTTLADRVGARLRAAGASGRTISLKARLYDFTTLSRSATLPGPTDDSRSISALAVRLLREVDTTGGVRLLGVGVSGLSDWVQADLFAPDDLAGAQVTDLVTSGAITEDVPPDAFADATAPVPDARAPDALLHEPRRWVPGADVVHAELGRGWVWGSGIGRVTVRFETADTPPGPVRTFLEDDPDLAPAPLPSPASE
jgi:DNA polymerase-4